MFNLFERRGNGEVVWLGDYKTLKACHRATELRWDVLQTLGYSRGEFHCTREDSEEISACWVYKG
jgi:hypothetical protein